ncbi:hypothetical protein A0H81_11456 [Grifola frondosa]|uniref:Uncharacterized protein n=1 Tax=Grifola frondosa TaxID=5627 RepID=A0A1C7M095_GRIFR|nr:hypothetical protein A0H81_11456 [Grifola frondosa]
MTSRRVASVLTGTRRNVYKDMSSPTHDQRLGDLEAGEADPLHEEEHGAEAPFTPAYASSLAPVLANS